MHFVEKEPIQKRKDFTEKLKSKKILRMTHFNHFIRNI